MPVRPTRRRAAARRAARGRSVRSCRRDVPLLLAATTARTVAWTALALVLWAVLPAASGAHVTTVASGSMAPAILRGDVVAALPVPATAPAGDVAVPGRVLLARDPDHEGRLRLHRLVAVDDDGRLRLRGDANDAPDTSTVATADVLGTGFLRVPWVGLPGLWLRGHEAAPLLASAVAAVLVLAAARLDRDLVRGLPCPWCGAPRSTVLPLPAAPRGQGPVAACAVLLVAGLVAGGAPASAAFSTTTDGAATLGTPASYPCYRHHDDGDAVLAWDFDEAGGATVVDRTGHGRDGVASGDVARVDAPCSGDPSATLTAAGDARVSTTARTPGPSSFTVSVWFRTSRPEGRVVGFSSERTPASLYKDRHLYLGSDGRLRFGVQGGTNGFRHTLVTPGRVDDGAWHHAVGTARAGRMEFWLDGARVGTRTDLTSLFTYPGHWRVGRESLDPWPAQPSASAFTGEVDTVRVWERPLDAAEVVALYGQGR